MDSLLLKKVGFVLMKTVSMVKTHLVAKLALIYLTIVCQATTKKILVYSRQHLPNNRTTIRHPLAAQTSIISPLTRTRLPI